jgi:hypothetical protein
MPLKKRLYLTKLFLFFTLFILFSEKAYCFVKTSDIIDFLEHNSELVLRHKTGAELFGPRQAEESPKIKNAHIYQLKVLSQDRKEYSCVFHAFKNSFTITEACQESPERLTFIQDERHFNETKRVLTNAALSTFPESERDDWRSTLAVCEDIGGLPDAFITLLTSKEYKKTSMIETLPFLNKILFDGLGYFIEGYVSQLHLHYKATKDPLVLSILLCIPFGPEEHVYAFTFYRDPDDNFLFFISDSLNIDYLDSQKETKFSERFSGRAVHRAIKRLADFICHHL